LLTDISPDKWWMWRKDQNHEYDYWYAVCKKCLSLLSLTKVFDGEKELIPLDEPDPNLLPLNLLGV